MHTTDTDHPYPPVTDEEISKTAAAIQHSLDDWESGRMTSPDQRDYVIDACRVLGVDWNDHAKVVEEIAEEIYEDAGEELLSVEDIAKYALMRLKEFDVTDEFGKTVAQMKREIASDVKKGVIPNTVASFGELHDFVDANEYGSLTTDRCWMSHEQANAVQTTVDLWIKDGALADVQKGQMREFLVHLNIQIECEEEDIDVETVEREIQGALEVGLGDMSYTPHLQGAEIVIALAEEI
jgi:small nuclear ribonucleoprotein (snRNP)-like protein